MVYMSSTFVVKTNLNPEQLTEVAMETYRLWLQFALGQAQIGGFTLAHPSGRYAASMSWRRTGVASIAIIADEQVAPEADWIEEGHAAFDIRAKMLKGQPFRRIPIRRDGQLPENSTPQIIENRMGGRISKPQGKIWAQPRAAVDAVRWVTMSSNPKNGQGKPAWIVPAMTPYAPAKILSDLLAKQYGNA
jgi:hypothetical protein